MTKFFDSLSGEYRELNYHGIKCKREPEPEITVDPAIAACWAARMADPGYAFGLAAGAHGTAHVPLRSFGEARERNLAKWREDMSALDAIAKGNVWGTPANRKQECTVQVIDGLKYLGHLMPGESAEEWLRARGAYDEDGFIAWHGGEGEPCPGICGQISAVKFRDGEIARVMDRHDATALRWTHIGRSSDIVGYRVLP